MPIAAPIPVRQPIQVWMKWGQAKGKRQVKAALHAAIANALELAVQDAIDYMREIVPESIKRRPPYSAKQQERSEALMKTAIGILEDSLTQMLRGGF